MAIKILKNVLEKICLSKSEEVELKGEVKTFIKDVGRVNFFIGGSFAKGTMVKKDKQDIDVFVVFDGEDDTRKLGKLLKKFKPRVKHGSRDYFQIKRNGVIFEIIPVVDFKKKVDVKNITDFSLSHVKYIKKKLRNKKISDGIKLAKVFCFANNFYGAESYINGFSGYALELLVIYFGGFEKFLKGIQKKKYIDIEKGFKNEKEARREINTSKLQSPILLVDPTYKYRNAGAGLSEETFQNFLDVARGFLKSPLESFFEKKEFDESWFRLSCKKKKLKFIKLNLKTDRQEGDIAGTKMKKFFRFIIFQLERKEQKVLMSEFIYSGSGQKAVGYFGVKEKNIIEIKGPPVSNVSASSAFKNSRKFLLRKNGFWVAKEKIRIDDIFEFVKKFSKEMGAGIER